MSERDELAPCWVRRTIRQCWGLACALGLIATGSLSAAEPQTPPVTEQEIAALIKQLGDPQVALRDAASERLAQIGLPAKQQLEAAVRAEKGPISRRAELVLVNIARRADRARLKNFVEGTSGADGDSDALLPGWERYRLIVGDTGDTRRLFVEMYRLESPLLKASDENSERVPKLLASRYKAYERAGRRADTASLAAMLLVLETYPGEFPELLSLRILVMTQGRPFAERLGERGAETPLGKLLAAWIAKPGDADLRIVEEKTRVATRCRLAAGLGPALELLSSDNRRCMLTGLTAFAVLGGREQISQIEPMLPQQTLTWQLPLADGEVSEVQMRDLFLAVLVHLSRQSLTDFGFKHREPDKRPSPHDLRTLYFADGKAREQALAQWRAWSETNRQTQPSERSASEPAHAAGR